MRNVNTTVFGLNYAVELPYNSCEEYDQQAGKAGASCEVVDQYFLAHRHASRVRPVVIAKLEELSGVARESETNEETKAVKYIETEQQYLTRAKAECEAAGNWDSIALVLVEVASDVKAEVIATRTSKVGKEFLEQAKAAIDAGKAEEVKGKLEAYLGISIDLSGDVDADTENLGRAFKAFWDKKKAEALAGL